MSEQPAVRLRQATLADSSAILEWANDPVTRANSFRPGVIATEEHTAWFERMLAALDHHLFIAEDDEGTLGMLRLDLLPTDPAPSADASADRASVDGTSLSRAVVSINVAPSARGRGVGGRMLDAAKAVAKELGVAHLEAFIRPSNQASQKVFLRAGYVLVATAQVADQDAERYELRL